MRKFLIIQLKGVLSAENEGWTETIVNAFNKIIDTTGCKIVVIWSLRTTERINQQFEKYGIHKKLYSRTESTPTSSKQEDLQAWLNEHLDDGDTYAILDCDYYYSESQSDHIVLVNWHIGLTDENADEAIKVLTDNGHKNKYC